MTAAEEYTPAVERAAELLIREAETTGLIRDDVRNGLAVALDRTEMAAALAIADGYADLPDAVEHGDDMRFWWAAEGLRSALLGGAS